MQRGATPARNHTTVIEAALLAKGPQPVIAIAPTSQAGVLLNHSMSKRDEVILIN